MSGSIKLDAIHNDGRLYDLKTVGAVLGVGAETVRMRIDRKQLQAVRCGVSKNRYRLYVTGQEIHRYLAALKTLGRR